MLGCTAAATGIGPDPAPQEDLPLGRSTHMRSGQFTYRLGRIEQKGSELRIDFHFSNGTHRSYHTVMLRAVVFGDAGEIHAVRLPVGGMLAEQTRPLAARIEGVTFPARDVTFELIYALP
jgi:hypothetical protein